MSDEPSELSTPLPWGNGPYSIKRHGQSLTTCESEPTRTPGCIQAHGVLFSLRISDLTILQVSENTACFFPDPPQALLGQPISRVIGNDKTEQLRELLSHHLVERSVKYVFNMLATDGITTLDVSMHTNGGVLLLEFEATHRNSDHDGRDYFSIVKAAICRIQAANNLRDFCQRVTEELAKITGIDRNMVYRFHPDFHGEVFAESKRADLHSLLGLHYPAEDIPKQARDIYKRIWIRPLPDAAGTLVEMVPLANPDTGQPLDMTYCSLRGASVMYTEYLANMGVRASLTMPILVDGELWGLIVGQHNSIANFPHQMREACEFLAQVVSLQLKSVEQSEQLYYRLKLEGVHQQLVARAAQAGDLMALSDHQPSLLDAMEADGAALFHLDRWWCTGKTPNETQLDELADWLNGRAEFDSATRPVFVTDSLVRSYPPGAAFVDVASGVLAVRVSRMRRDLILWFRPETIQTINWAGEPNTKPATYGPNGPRLTVRGSFDLFVESVKERATPWSPLEVDSALRLRMLVMELVVSRSERLAELNADLTRSNDELDAFAYVASHDLKEPLRGIHKYAHQLLESAQLLDQESRRRVENLMRLTVRMDSLLDSLLHFSRVGRTTLELEAVDLNEIIDESLEMVGARRSDCTLRVEVPRRLPTWRCDRVRVREIFTNLISNAMKYVRGTFPHIEIGVITPSETGERPNASAVSIGHTIFYLKDFGIGVETRHYEQIFRMFKRLHGRDEFGGGVGAGLTIVQKLVNRHGGCVWLDSVVGVGTTFYFTLPCGDEVQI